MGDGYILIDFEANIVYDNGTKEIWREDVCVNKDQRSEEILKQMVLKKIEDHAQDVEGREFIDKIKDKQYKNEDFAFSKIFEGKKNVRECQDNQVPPS